MGSQGGCPIPQEGIHHLTAAHADVLGIVVKMDIHLTVGGGDHLHVAHLAVDDRLGQIEFRHHAKRNRPTTGFGIIQLPFKQPGFDASFGQNFRSTGSAGAAPDNRNAQHLETSSSKGFSQRS